MESDTQHLASEDQLVIIGASHCGVQCAFSARRGGFAGRIILIGDETELPYHRPPLSKDLLTGEKDIDQVLLRPATSYEKSTIEFRAGIKVASINRNEQKVITDDGDSIQYSYLILATGARPRQLPISGSTLANVHYLRNIEDARALQLDQPDDKKVVVIGGGYIGLEAAASLRKLGASVTIVEAMDRLLQRVASPGLSDFYERLHTEEGVNVITGCSVNELHGSDSVSSASLSDGTELAADLVVIGIGVIPNVELAKDAGLDTDNGIVVDGYARTSDPQIYAAGDCAFGYNELYQKHQRIESVQNANDQAKTAVSHLLGTESTYAALPWFWSDQFDTKLQIAGLIGDSDETIVRGDLSRNRAFSICHLINGSLMAVEAVNSPRDFLQSKALIASGAKLDRAALEDSAKALTDCVISEVPG